MLKKMLVMASTITMLSLPLAHAGEAEELKLRALRAELESLSLALENLQFRFNALTEAKRAKQAEIADLEKKAAETEKKPNAESKSSKDAGKR